MKRVINVKKKTNYRCKVGHIGKFSNTNLATPLKKQERKEC